MNQNKLLLPIMVSVGLLIFLVLPYLVLGMEAYVPIHGNLESEFIYLHILKKSSLLFRFNSDISVENIMNGIKLSYFHSQYNILRLLFYLFPSFNAYVINLLIVRMVGFWGMWLLTKDHILKEKPQHAVILAIFFALIPTNTLYGLSILGQPLLIWAFLKLIEGKSNRLYWLIICLFPIYSHIAFSSIFIVILLLGYALLRLIRQKSIHPHFMLGLLSFAVLYALSNISILASFRVEDMIGVLTESDAGSIKRIILEMLTVGLRGAEGISDFWAIPIYISVLIALILNRKDSTYNLHLISAIIGLLLIAVCYAIYPWLIETYGESAPILKVLRIRNFSVLIPLCWFLLFAFALQRVRLPSWVIYVLIFAQGLLIVGNNNVLVENTLRTINIERKTPSFDDFYSPRLFQSVKAYIARPLDTYRVVSVGMPPSVAQYNGFYTLDGYKNIYPSDYKLSFRVIIAEELVKNEALRKDFDEVGNRCYIFSAELYEGCYLDCHKEAGESIEQLTIDTAKLKELGANYLLSAVPIDNHQAIGLNLERKFSREDAYWDIYLYKIN